MDGKLGLTWLDPERIDFKFGGHLALLGMGDENERQ